MNAVVAESGKKPVSKHQIQPGVWRMSKLARDGTGEPVSRDRILRRANGDREKNDFPSVQLTTRRRIDGNLYY